LLKNLTCPLLGCYPNNGRALIRSDLGHSRSSSRNTRFGSPMSPPPPGFSSIIQAGTGDSGRRHHDSQIHLTRSTACLHPCAIPVIPNPA
jgi:hypothetical protein